MNEAQAEQIVAPAVPEAEVAPPMPEPVSLPEPIKLPLDEVTPVEPDLEVAPPIVEPSPPPLPEPEPARPVVQAPSKPKIDPLVPVPAAPSPAPEVPSAPVATPGEPIRGQAKLSAAQMASFLLATEPNPKISVDAQQLAQYFLDEGARLGIRGDIAFAQSIKETGWFRYGGSVVPEQNNYAGLGATGGAVGGAWFDSAQIGVRAQIQHLYAYATTDGLPDAVVDPRYDALVEKWGRGVATSWEGLNGKWAVPGNGYGEDILRLYNNMASFGR